MLFRSKDSDISEWEFLNHVAKRTGCYFLLDVNNLWVNQVNKIAQAKDFLQSIDLSRVRQIHIAGASHDQGTLVDTHDSEPHEDTIALLSSLEPKKHAWPIVYERDGNLTSMNANLTVATQLGGKLECH